jgi:hypothetical protein
MGSMLNPERVPALAPKFSNQIGKTCSGFSIRYTMTGVVVNVDSLLDESGGVLDVDDAEEIGIPEWERRRALKNTPSDDERLAALRRKYELRLNREFPANGPASGAETAIQAWLGTLAFAERRALLMSQRDFSKSYPEGFRA